jgi:uncharacterized protein (DUF433 family)
MKLATSQKVPLTQWKDGTVRITGTRVPLDVIVNQFKLGATAEQIHDSFPAVSLKDIYGSIYYYLEHTDAVDAYMREQQQAVAETRQWVESQPGNRVLRERLLARRQPAMSDAQPQSPCPRPSPQGTPEALPSPMLRRRSSTSQRRAAGEG